jgi:hypothetical protein
MITMSGLLKRKQKRRLHHKLLLLKLIKAMREQLVFII